jgi:D-inositol-3-phosphate glycosyltransferase
MKICLVAESYPPALGGAEFALQKIVEGFIAKGNEVWVVTSSWQRHDSSFEHSGPLRISRVKTLRFFHRLWFILFSLPTVLKASRWADIVQGSTFAGDPPAFFGGWLAGKKKSLVVYEVWGNQWHVFERSRVRSLFYRIMEWTIVRLPFDQYIAISHFTKRCLQSLGVAGGKIIVVHLGDSSIDVAGFDRIAARKRLGFDMDDFVFVTFGRVGISKGFEYFSAAIPKLVDILPRARFVLILSGYDRRIWEQVRKNVVGIPESRCRLLSSLPRAELAEYASVADCFVIPSLSEGFGFSAIESCNAGKIVVSTDAGSLPEVVSGKHVFVKPGLTEALVQGCMRAFTGEVDIAPRKEFDWNLTVGKYIQLYEGLMRRED